MIGIRIQTRIVNGTDAIRGQFPHNVELSARGSNFFFCGGSIITNWHILSAAHCVLKYISRPTDLLAYFDAKILDDMAFHTEMKEVVPHPEYSKFQNDISILRTAKEIEFTEFVHAIALPTSDLPHPYGFTAVFAAWGAKWVSQ